MGVGRERRWVAAALAGALALCGLAAGDISFTDIVGEYHLWKGNLGFCKRTAAVSQGAATLPGDALSFGGKACDAAFKYALHEAEAPEHWTPAGRAASGIVLLSLTQASSIMSCPNGPNGIVLMAFVRPHKAFPLSLNGFAKPVELPPSVRYWILWRKDGACVYRHVASALSPSPSAPSPPPRSPPSRRESASAQGGGGASDGADGLNIWVWLGPVLGAAATMAAALVTVCRCVRRDARDKAADLSGSEAEPAHAEAGDADGALSFAPPPAGYP